MVGKEDLVKMLNQALELEHVARIQYLAHAEIVTGVNAEPIIARLKEIAGDEKKYEEMFRDLIGNCLDDVPSMGMAETHPARTIDDILSINLRDAKHAVDVYTGILKKANEIQNDLKYEYMRIEHEVRHIILDEEEHISELRVLQGRM
jgi:bacterioferritin (cytochrome b1)